MLKVGQIIKEADLNEWASRPNHKYDSTIGWDSSCHFIGDREIRSLHHWEDGILCFIVSGTSSDVRIKQEGFEEFLNAKYLPFSLPNKWKIKAETAEQAELIAPYATKLAKEAGRKNWSTNDTKNYWLCVSNGKYSTGSGNPVGPLDFTSITFDQFKKYVLNKPTPVVTTELPPREDLVGRYLRALVDRPTGGSVKQGECGLITKHFDDGSLSVNFPSQHYYGVPTYDLKDPVKYKLMPVGFNPSTVTPKVEEVKQKGWCVEVTPENRAIVNTYFHARGHEYVGYNRNWSLTEDVIVYYPQYEKGCWAHTNNQPIKPGYTKLSTEEFYKKIGHTSIPKESLLEEAKRRYPAGTKYHLAHVVNDNEDTILPTDEFVWETGNPSCDTIVARRNTKAGWRVCVYKGGKWAEIIKKPQSYPEYVECLGNSAGQFTKGKIYKFKKEDNHGFWLVEKDDRGSTTNGMHKDLFKPATREAYEKQESKQVFDTKTLEAQLAYVDGLKIKRPNPNPFVVDHLALLDLSKDYDHKKWKLDTEGIFDRYKKEQEHPKVKTLDKSILIKSKQTKTKLIIK